MAQKSPRGSKKVSRTAAKHPTPPTITAIKAPVGRPSTYAPSHVKHAFHLALLGATNVAIARAFSVAESTLTLWISRHPEFSAALKAGREEADGNVSKSLYRRALGYSHKAVKIITVAQGGNMGSVVEEVPYIERYPPDTTAGIFWLKNRRPDLWRDKHEHEFTDVSKLSDEELEKRRKAMGLA